MSEALKISVDGDVAASLREYVHANVRLKAYKPGIHEYDMARLDVLLKAETLASAVAVQVAALKGIEA